MQTKATWQALILNITILLFFMLSCSRCNLHKQAICNNSERFSNKWQGTPNVSYNFQSYFMVSWNLLEKKKKCLFLFSYLINIFALISFVFSRNKNTRNFWVLDQLNATVIEIFYFKQLSRCCHLFLFRNTISRTHPKSKKR